MIIDLSKINMKESPMLLLKNQSGHVISPLCSVMHLKGTLCYNEISQLTFEIPKHYNGQDVEEYDSIIGMRIVEWKDIGQFILLNPTIVGDGIHEIKQCTIYSLEYEFINKKISLENATYNFWNPVTPKSTILGIILSYMPSWSVGTVDSSLVGKYRTYEIDNENLYDFMKNTLQEAYNCIFEFDTMNRKINVRDANKEVSKKPVYLSTHNLVKEIEIEEDTENLITVLDVNGADGVNIRSVNPIGTNKIYNLDYFMNTTNFDQSMIDKWNEWKATYAANQELYYNISLNQSVQIARYNTEYATLTDMQGELSNLEAQQAVVIQAIAQGLSTQSDLTAINAQISSQNSKIRTQKSLINSIQSNIDSITEQLKEIVAKTEFAAFFTDDELILLDRYFKEDSITDSSFVAASVKSYTETDVFSQISNCGIVISGAEISSVAYSGTKTFYSIRNGTLRINHSGFDITAEIIRGTYEYNTDKSIVFSCYLNDGSINGESFESGNISVTGYAQSKSNSSSSLQTTLSSANCYFTKNVTDYEQRQIEWDLYEYGEEQLKRMSSPTYSFKLSSINFFALDDYHEFTNQISLGERVYVETSMGVITPIIIGVDLDYDGLDGLSIEFGSKFNTSLSAFDLKDLVKESVSMGKSVDFNKYNYNKFVDSGAESSVREFMTSALDVAKNAILSSSGQAISWGKEGFRLRKWANESEGTYDPKQIWMANNSIMFTQDNWENAVIGIGEFVDKNLGTCYGIVLPNLFGTLLAGENLIIESIKEDGGTAVFRVDGEGAFLHNADFNVVSNGTQITLNADHCIGIGKYPLYTQNSDGEEVINEDNAKFWVDTDGNLHIKGKLHGCDGIFSGELKAATGTFSGQITGGSINIGNGNFKVDSGGNLTANQGLFKGTIQGATYKDSSGNYMTNSNEQFTAKYLSLYGLTITNGSQTTFSVSSNGAVNITGNVTMAAGSSINWANVSETNVKYNSAYSLASSAYNYADLAYDYADEAYGYADEAYANRVTARNVFNTLTNNGTLFGVFSDYNGGLYINASYIRTGILDADLIQTGTIDATVVALDGYYGGFKVAYGDDGTGYGSTLGAKMYGTNERNYFIATNKGVRMTVQENSYIYVINGAVVSSHDIQVTSDMRCKNSIAYNMDKYDEFYMRLKPCYFKMNNDVQEVYHTGFIAQEVKQALLDSNLSVSDFAGFNILQSNDKTAPDKHVLSYTSFIALNTHMIQKLMQRVKILEAEICTLKEKN